MTKFNKFDKANLKALRSEMEAVLKKYGMASNLEFEVGNMRFSTAEVEIKVKAKVKGAKSRADSQLEMYAKMFGLKMKNSNGDVLVEFKSRNTKYPFIFERGGKRYKCSELQAKTLFAA